MTCPTTPRFDEFFCHVITQIVNPVIELLFALALVYFLYGVFEFIANQSNDEAKTKGKSHMLWGIVGLTIMMGVWGILNVLLNTIGVDKGQVDPQNGAVHLNDINTGY